jgi:hypothetical protein
VGNSVGANGWRAIPGVASAPGSRALGVSTPLAAYNSTAAFGRRAGGPLTGPAGHGSYLVDSASSHMLVSKIKPCMSKYKQSIR